MNLMDQIWIWLRWTRTRVRNLEVEDDGPDEAEDHRRLPVHHVAGVDVHQLDLIQKLFLIVVTSLTHDVLYALCPYYLNLQ